MFQAVSELKAAFLGSAQSRRVSGPISSRTTACIWRCITIKRLVGGVAPHQRESSRLHNGQAELQRLGRRATQFVSWVFRACAKNLFRSRIGRQEGAQPHEVARRRAVLRDLLEGKRISDRYRRMVPRQFASRLILYWTTLGAPRACTIRLS